MKILAHRGYWNSKIENNSSVALRTALEKGYGFESDVRDYCGKLVISHNIADENAQDAAEVFEWLKEFQDQYCFAINIKADGLKYMLNEQLKMHNISNYFAFDMSVPQMMEFADSGINFYTRQSESEKVPVMYENAAGIWIDSFFNELWITESLMRKHIVNGKKVCIVSSELHQRNYRELWDKMIRFDIDFSKVMLCTDYPDEAAAFFGNLLER